MGVLADEDRAGLRSRLQSRRGVDDVAGHHALSGGTDGDGGLTREHACTR